MPVGCQEAKRLGESVQFGGLFAGALEDISGLNEELLFSFSKLLRLTLPQQLSLGLGLVQSVSSEATQQEGAKFLKSKLNELNANNGGSVPPSIVQQLLFHLQTHDGFAKQKASFVKIYRQLIPEVHAPVSLVPALYNELPEVDSKRTYDPEVLPFSPSAPRRHLRLPLSAYRRSTDAVTAHAHSPAACIALLPAGAIGSHSALSFMRPSAVQSPLEDTSLLCVSIESKMRVCDMIEDIGYMCTASAQQLLEVFNQFPRLTEPDVALIIAMMARTHMAGLVESVGIHGSGKGDVAEPKLTAWNTQVLVQALADTNPRLDWKQARP